jgi:hypothetical protein
MQSSGWQIFCNLLLTNEVSHPEGKGLVRGHLSGTLVPEDP